MEDRAEKWLEETDEFGMMMMSMGRLFFCSLGG